MKFTGARTTAEELDVERGSKLLRRKHLNPVVCHPPEQPPTVDTVRCVSRLEDFDVFAGFKFSDNQFL